MDEPKALMIMYVCMRSYFSSRFPNLLMATYCFGLHRCAEEPMLAKYYPAGAREFPLELMSTRLAAATGAPATAANAADAIRVRHSTLSSRQISNSTLTLSADLHAVPMLQRILLQLAGPSCIL